MKHHCFLFVLCLFFSVKLFSQVDQSNTIHLAHLPPEGIILDKGWKFKAGDSIEWAKPSYDDGSWQPVNPLLTLHHLPKVREAGIGWLRIKLNVDPALFNQTVAIDIRSIGASEFFINGRPAYRFGVVSSDSKKEEAHLITNRQFSLKLDDQQQQVLAVRYSFNKSNLYVNFGNVPFCMQLIVKDINKGYGDYFKVAGFYSVLRSIQVSFYLPLGLLIFFLYFSFRRRKEYLYFGSFCFFMFAGMMLQIVALLQSATVTQAHAYLLVANVFWIAGQLYWLNGTYIHFEEKKTWFYRLILLYGWLIIPFYFISHDWSGIFSACFSPLANLEFARLSIRGIKRKQPGSWIFLITSIVLMVLLLLWIGFLLAEQYAINSFLLTVCFVTPAAGLSFFVAADFARTGSALQARVVEVEELSAKMIAQGIEKQQILAQQNETLEKQVVKRTSELKLSIEELKAAQAQLIQREKMASLGELTAGIAHEIQNPLNFVKNFSEVCTELINEMQHELDSANTINALTLASDIKNTLQKITNHSKRADAIVKGMLQHSRAGTGQKEAVDINDLIEEHYMLSYHGWKTKDKTFEAAVEMKFDRDLESLEIIPQDIARVFLNLFTNSFYSLGEKKKQLGEGYKPMVSVTTGKPTPDSRMIEIRVRDNGLGIPQKLLDKIFQPFFTTKPSGQGTGLGLSLSYDVIKAHGGTLRVETKEDEFAEFIIELPM
jgi:two-component system NtrC family sensor kinase